MVNRENPELNMWVYQILSQVLLMSSSEEFSNSLHHNRSHMPHLKKKKKVVTLDLIIFQVISQSQSQNTILFHSYPPSAPTLSYLQCVYSPSVWSHSTLGISLS